MRGSSMFALLPALIVALVHTQSSAQVPSPPVLLNPATSPQCSDGIDNDGDGLVDFPTDGVPNGGRGDDGCMDPSDNDERAGKPANVTVRSCGGSTLNTAGATYDGCVWTGDVTIAAENITIRNSQLGGRLVGSRASTLVEDTTFTGPNSNHAYVVNGGGQGGKESGTFRRIRCTHYSTCFYTQGPVIVEDSAIYDIYNKAAECHVENVLLSGSGAAVFRRNWIYANWYNGERCSNGGISAVIAMYSHSRDGWSATHNKILEGNRIQMPNDASWYHVYFGRSGSDGNTPTNMRSISNIFVGNTYGGSPAVVGWARHGTNVWSDNWRGSAATTTKATASAWAEPNTSGY